VASDVADLHMGMSLPFALHGQLADLGVQLLNALLRILGQRLSVGEELGGVLEQLLLPGRDLRRMHLMLLSELGERLVAADRLQGDLGFEGRRMITTGSFHGHCSSQRLG